MAFLRKKVKSGATVRKRVLLQVKRYDADDEGDLKEEPEEEEEPIPKQAPAGFAPQWIGGHDPNNNKGWIEEDEEE
ncbi:hypothetical protein Tco_0912397 [Tanacetum coccineum]